MKLKLLSVTTFLGVLIYPFSISASTLLGEPIYGCAASSSVNKDCSALPLDGGNIFSPDTAVIKNSGIEFIDNTSEPGFTESADFGESSLKLFFGYNGNGLGGALTSFWFFKLLNDDVKITDVQLVNSNTEINALVFSFNSITVITDTIVIKPGESLFWDFKVDVKPVPIPAALWLFSAGLAGMIGINRRLKSVK